MIFVGTLANIGLLLVVIGRPKKTSCILPLTGGIVTLETPNRLGFRLWLGIRSKSHVFVLES